MTDLQQWAKSEIERCNGNRQFAKLLVGGFAASAPFNMGAGALVAGFFHLCLEETKADKYYVEELHKILHGQRFTKVTQQEAEAKFPSGS